MKNGCWVYVARDNYEAATNGRYAAGAVVCTLRGTGDAPPEIGAEGAKIIGLVFVEDDPNGIYKGDGLRPKEDAIDFDLLKAAHPESADRLDAILNSKAEPLFDHTDAPTVGAEVAATTAKEAISPAEIALEMAIEFGGPR